MAIPVLIMGRSGSGKTYSIKNFAPNEVGVISIEKGRLPFKSDIKTVRIPASIEESAQTAAQVHIARYAWLQMAIKTSKVKSIVIDDSQNMLLNEYVDRKDEKGFDKFAGMAKNFIDLIHGINNYTEDGKIVYLLHHSEADANGREKAKTIGKMLDEKMVVEGYFDIVLYCEDHKFFTQGNGQSTAKSPEGMFESIEIPNDLKMVDDAIRSYWGLSK